MIRLKTLLKRINKKAALKQYSFKIRIENNNLINLIRALILITLKNKYFNRKINIIYKTHRFFIKTIFDEF